jgi:hypothetical protein
MDAGGGRGCLDIDIVIEEEAEGGLERKAMAIWLCLCARSVWVVVKGPFLGFDGWKQVGVCGVCRSRPRDPCALSEPRSISLLSLSLPCYAHSSIAAIAGRSRATGGSREWGCRRRITKRSDDRMVPTALLVVV